jgi:hypothetical protein
MESPESRIYREVYVSAIRKGITNDGANTMAQSAIRDYKENFDVGFSDGV